MQKLDYYAGYPNQQKAPKWVGVTLGSLFGGLTIVMLAVGIRIAMPPRQAEASVAPKPQAAEPVVAAAPAPQDEAPVARADRAPASELGVTRYSSRHHGKSAKGKKSHGKVAMFAKAPVRDASSPRYKKAAAYGKAVASNHRDKKARDDLDKMLGL
jgi:hypothetical protein